MVLSKTSSALKVAAILFIIMCIALAKDMILPLLLAIFLSIILIRPVVYLVTKKVPYTIAVVLILFLTTTIFIIIGSVVGNSLSNFLSDLPQYEIRIIGLFEIMNHKFNAMGIDINTEQLFKSINPTSMMNFTSDLVSNLGELISDSFVILLITIFLLLEAPSFLDKSVAVERYYNTSFKHLDKVGKDVRHYLSIKTMISALTGLFIWFWLWILGIDYAILWGVVAFLLNYIPNVGSIIAAIPTLLLALIQLGISGFIWTGLGYFLANFVMGNILEPKILGKGLGLSTLVVLLSLIFWGYILGPVGMFLSVPLTITIKIMLENGEKTQWIAILLGTSDDAHNHITKMTKDFKQDY